MLPPPVRRRPARLHTLERVQRVSRPREEVFGFFADASNLGTITPAFLRFAIATPMPVEMRPGASIDYTLTLFGVRLAWRTRITAWEHGRRFVDEQESGPYAFWRHLHEFEADGAGTIIRDRVEYALPFVPLGDLAHRPLVRPMLERIFDHRRDVVARRFGPAPSAPAHDRAEVVGSRD